MINHKTSSREAMIGIKGNKRKRGEHWEFQVTEELSFG